MRARKITAIFQGQDGSLGFRKGQKYEIIVKHQGFEFIMVESGQLSCEYQSMISFLDNWNDIKVIGEPKVEFVKN